MADAATVVGTASQTLTALALCGVMGLIGQTARAVVGLKNATSAKTPPEQREPFSPAYLFVSLMIGAIAGILAGVLMGLEKFTTDVTMQSLIGIAGAGYAGADFIENAMSLVLPKLPGAGPGPGVAAAAPPQVAAALPAPAPAAARAAIAPPPPIAPRIVTVPPGQGRRATPAPVPALAPAPVALEPAGTTAAAFDPEFAAALRAVAPGVDAPTWVPALLQGFERFGLTTDRRQAAAIGQFLVEAGSAFTELEEDLYYTHADAVMRVFGSRFRDEADAEAYLRDPERLANRVYADRLGNGDEASGDGWRYRGRGLIQLTGKATYAEFAFSLHMSVADAATLCGTPDGAALSGCWYLASRNCLSAADRWDLAAITLAVNGSAMLGASKRAAYANAMLSRLQAGAALVA